MTDAGPPQPIPLKFRRPERTPSAATVADRDRWQQMADDGLAVAQASAEKWRAGLAAFVSLVTAGLLIKGPEAARDISRDYRLAITILGVGGLLLAVYGLWSALRAAAGNPSLLRYEQVISTHGSIRQYELFTAGKIGDRLRTARRCVAISLALLGATVIVWWWAPVEALDNVAVVHGDETTCGQLVSADNGKFVVQVAGASNLIKVRFTDVENVTLKADC